MGEKKSSTRPPIQMEFQVCMICYCCISFCEFVILVLLSYFYITWFCLVKEIVWDSTYKYALVRKKKYHKNITFLRIYFGKGLIRFASHWAWCVWSICGKGLGYQKFVNYSLNVSSFLCSICHGIIVWNLIIILLEFWVMGVMTLFSNFGVKQGEVGKPISKTQMNFEVKWEYCCEMGNLARKPICLNQ